MNVYSSRRSNANTIDIQKYIDRIDRDALAREQRWAEERREMEQRSQAMEQRWTEERKEMELRRQAMEQRWTEERQARELRWNEDRREMKEELRETKASIARVSEKLDKHIESSEIQTLELRRWLIGLLVTVIVGLVGLGGLILNG